ncbi:MAG: SirB2 family protein [Woeseiaceae bacterium]|jgi:uncharacterized membrane protein SirB2|nr:SirB2 family protein [Woeseiaceae bacterium]
MYGTFKLIHAATAVLTISGFLLRGFWMFTESPLLKHKLTRVLPHIVDTLFLGSGIALLFFIGTAPLTKPWMLLKFAGLIAYVVLAVIALKRGRTMATKATAFVAALAVFAYTYGVAVSMSPASWLAVLAG